MKTRTLIFGNCALWVAGAAYIGNWTIVVVALMAHVLFLVLHNIEVKVNKLLEHNGIFVADKDLAE